MENRDINRRDFVRVLGAGALGFAIPNYAMAQDEPRKIIAKEFTKLPSPEYVGVSHSEIEWEPISEGLDFSRTEVYKKGNLIDIIAGVKINPSENKIKVFNSYSKGSVSFGNIEEWQKKTNALAIINSAQYMGRPSGCPCALVICDGKQKGPKFNQVSQGMLVAEPITNDLPAMDLIDFNYDPKTGEENNYQELQTAYRKTRNSKDLAKREKAKEYLVKYKDLYYDIKENHLEKYSQGVQHWGMFLDREENIRITPSLWQANRTAVAKTKDNEILFMTTEGGYFTLYNLGQFLRDSNKRSDKGFNVHTAMNMDGGYEASMAIETPKLSYFTYGEFETQGPGRDMTVFGARQAIPGVIGVFPRDY